jgi:diguanylate cyclase
VTTPTPPIDSARAARDLDKLRRQGVTARAELSRLQKKVTDAEQRLLGSHAAQMLEANAELVCSTLQAQTRADEAARALLQISRQVDLDPLTKLPNRDVFVLRLANAIAMAKRHATRVAVLFLDLNNFKHINDSLGHAVGDDALRQAALALVGCVRETDTVSRHSGDEFLLLLPQVSQVDDALQVAGKVLATLAEARFVLGHEIRLTASIGVAVYPEDGEDVASLIESADAAMYRAKREGPGSFIAHGTAAPSAGETPLSRLVAAQAALLADAADVAATELRYLQLREVNEQLVLAVLDSQALHTAAELAHRMQKEFLAVVAHELRNPLTPIRVAATLLNGARLDELPQLQETIERQVVHMSRLVGDLLDVSRANTGKLRLQRRDIELAQVIGDAVATCRPHMDERRQRLDVTLPGTPLAMYGDPVRLAQILTNLLDNASKYTPEGGDIGLSAVIGDGSIVIAISDNGIGVPAEVLPDVFEPFVQDARAARFNVNGLGIGLTVVRELVEAHGGRVIASSDGDGYGSTFAVTLPIGGLPVAELVVRTAPATWNLPRRR